MADYFATFNVGFERLVYKEFCEFKDEFKQIQVLPGLIRFSTEKGIKRIMGLPFVNNLFYILHEFKGNNLRFEDMIKMDQNHRVSHLKTKGKTCRVRFSYANQFVHVPATVARQAEFYAQRTLGMKIDRGKPLFELWYLIRSEHVGYIALLIYRNSKKNNEVPKGALKPELANLIVRFSGVHSGVVLCDPFAGSGSIPEQVFAHAKVKKMYISDISPYIVKSLQQKFLGNKDAILFCENALHLRRIEDHSVDIIITDPPWGLYKKINNIEAFYESFLSEAVRILVSGGTLVMLVSRHINLCRKISANLHIEEKIDILVNGKKASLYRMVAISSTQDIHMIDSEL